MLVEIGNTHKIKFFICAEQKAERKRLYRFQFFSEQAQQVKIKKSFIYTHFKDKKVSFTSNIKKEYYRIKIFVVCL